MRLLRCTISGRFRLSTGGAGSLFGSNARPIITPSFTGYCNGTRRLHSVCSRLSTLIPPLRIPERPNVRLVKDHSEFHDTVYFVPERDCVKSEDLVLSVFVSQQNTASLSIFDTVARLSTEHPGHRFLIIDADQVPRAAYDADLQQFPAVLLSFGGDIYRRLVQVSGGYPDNWQASPQWGLPSCSSDIQPSVECTLPETFYESVKREIKTFSANYNGREIASLKSRAGTHSYSHGIDTDNLNVKRVGWPTE
ncbi:uncharacterized protein BXIN_0531 [Babesia sp. Xinjiang]|uniref:uncharacterized protein n=1 Tax=Babesia sp. Xinjiang TaxID=462227 RepID=UPI000A22EB22|nr:uncharacterized protein BXIN_0531 [Babesia sp. Xinjiang]ORM41887.1 hypothetical protein BXIN_0531 [Babesia sp. Xinjiang]